MLTFIGLLAFLALSISLELEEGMKDILTYLKRAKWPRRPNKILHLKMLSCL